MAIFLRPNPSSGVPTYLQLMEQVKHGLETGALRPGERVPGIRPLAEELVINPTAVARAYHGLEQEGVIALALENSRLAAEMAAEVALRVERNHELDLARDVQQRLFPQAYPAIAGFEYAGRSRPARVVGGDYYDFIRVSETVLGIAIGDVSGKGIPAALLMATLRAYLHGQTRQRVTDLTDVMVNLNRLVYESSAANRYATFFYAQYDASSRVFEYVNAGHNAPLVVRLRDGRQMILRLEGGGPVIGLMPECCYAQQRLTLEEGDVLVFFTDGITEAMNGAGDEWGEEHLTDVVRANRALGARELIDRIMQASDEFVAGAAQYDDMTLITARVVGSGSGAAW